MIEPFSATLAQSRCDQPGKSLEILHHVPANDIVNIYGIAASQTSNIKLMNPVVLDQSLVRLHILINDDCHFEIGQIVQRLCVN